MGREKGYVLIFQALRRELGIFQENREQNLLAVVSSDMYLGPHKHIHVSGTPWL